MFKFLAHDTVNDVAIIQTTFAVWVRYGLQQTEYKTLDEATEDFNSCVAHALRCNGDKS